ncbi:lipoprotein LpqB [Actinomyces denticolens]|uniref:GerMN domain-containing protein n=1 Tax=Actinomyces TaxID=1654 RepID=UPI0009816276|nr:MULTISPECIES: GerMN domain-containing protein [Actinomyces]SUU74268.1 lipoprotein LpqB [Actinomyces denticolens]
MSAPRGPRAASLPPRLPSRREAMAMLAVGGAGALASCSSLPMEGDVFQSDAVEDGGGVLVQTAPGPAEGADPEAIVEGFLRACTAGLSDGFATAREFLVEGAADSWQPLAPLLLASDSQPLTVRRARDGGVSISGRLEGSLDSTGVLSAQGLDYSETLTLVASARGQWRIASPPPGAIVQGSVLRTAYTQQSIRFLNAAHDRPIPDPRWLSRKRLEEASIEALLTGPAAWLKDVATTAIPSGTRLQDVKVVDRAATVRLSAVDTSWDPEAQALAVAQITATMKEIGGIDTVIVMAGDQRLATQVTTLDAAAEPGAVVGMSGGSVVRGTSTTRAVLMQPTTLGTSAARHPSLGNDGGVCVVSGPSILRVGPGGTQAASILSVGDSPADAAVLLPPRQDRHRWIWTASQGRLIVVDARGVRADVAAAWLEGRSVVCMDISAESGRIALRHRDAADPSSQSGERVDVAAIIRDREGRPTGLADPYPVAGLTGPGAHELAWYSGTELITIEPAQDGQGTPSLVVASLGALESTRSPGPPSANGIAANRLDQTMLLSDSDGQLWSRASGTWRVISTTVTDAGYPIV